MYLNKLSPLHSELAKFEEILVDYKRYKELLFQLSPAEWQEAQRAKAGRTKVLSDEDSRDKQELKEPADRSGEYFTLVQVQLSCMCT